MDDRLQKFARLAEIGSFTRAARDLHISQPALTLAIHKLEQELGTELLIRGNRKLDLTEAGRAAYQAALEHQNVTDQLRSGLNRIAKKRPAVVIGMTDSVAAVLCDTPAFEQLESIADVTIVVNNSRYLREAVERRQLDVAFIISDGAEHPTLAVNSAGIEELVLVSKTKVSLDQGKLNNFICYDKPSTTYKHIQHALQLLNIKPRITLYSTSPDVMLRMVLRGKGTAALPRFLVSDYVSNGGLSILRQGRQPIIIKRPVCTVRLGGKALTPCLKEFVGSVRVE